MNEKRSKIEFKTKKYVRNYWMLKRNEHENIFPG